MEGEAAEPDQEHEADEEIMVGAALLARAKQEKREPAKRRKQEGAVAGGIDRLGQERVARAALAIEEDVLAQCHGLCPLLPISGKRPSPAGDRSPAWTSFRARCPIPSGPRGYA